MHLWVIFYWETGYSMNFCINTPNNFRDKHAKNLALTIIRRNRHRCSKVKRSNLLKPSPRKIETICWREERGFIGRVHLQVRGECIWFVTWEQGAVFNDIFCFCCWNEKNHRRMWHTFDFCFSYDEIFPLIYKLNDNIDYLWIRLWNLSNNNYSLDENNFVKFAESL